MLGGRRYACAAVERGALAVGVEAAGAVVFACPCDDSELGPALRRPTCDYPRSAVPHRHYIQTNVQ